MIGEASVEGIEKESCILVLVNLFGEEVCHSVGEVESDLKIAEIRLELLQESDVIRLDVDLLYAAFLCCGRGRPAFFYPLFNLPETGIEAYGKRVLAGDLHAVVLSGIMRRRDLHGGLVAIVGGAEIDKRSTTEADVIDIRTCIRNTFN